MCLVFSAIRVNPLLDSQIHVPVDVLLIDSPTGFDVTKTFYNAKSSGFFLIHMSAGAGVPAHERLEYTLRKASSEPNVLPTHTAYNGELVTSRDDIQFVNEGRTLYMSSAYFLYSDGLHQRTWAGFKLDDFVAPLILFSVAKMKNYTTPKSSVQFDRILLNIGHACNNQFIVLRTGVYFFSFSSASISNISHQMELQISNIVKARSIKNSEQFNGTDTSSHSLLLPLNAGNIVTAFLYIGPYSDQQLPNITFKFSI